MDNISGFTEILVKKKADGKIVFLRVLIILGFAAVIAASLIAVAVFEIVRMFIMALPVLWLLVGLLCRYLYGFTFIEYEYAVVSGYFQLDAIYSKKSRKRLCEAKLSEVRAIAPVTPGNEAMRRPENFSKVIKAASSMSSENLFYMAYKDAKAGDTLVYFDADKKALDCFVYYNRKAVDRGRF